MKSNEQSLTTTTQRYSLLFMPKDILKEIFKWITNKKALANLRLVSKFFNLAVIYKVKNLYMHAEIDYFKLIQEALNNFNNLTLISFTDPISDKVLHLAYSKFVESIGNKEMLSQEELTNFIALLNKGVALSDELVARTLKISPACHKVLLEHLRLFFDKDYKQLDNIAINVRNSNGETLLANAIIRQSTNISKIIFAKASWSDFMFEDKYRHSVLTLLACSPCLIDTCIAELEQFPEVKAELERINQAIDNNEKLEQFDINKPLTAIAYWMLRNTTLKDKKLGIPVLNKEYKVTLDGLVGKDLLNAINIRDSWGKIVLHCAARDGNLDTFKSLLAKGSDIYCHTIHGRSALHYASTDGHLDIVKSLLANGADINAKSIYEGIVLHDAALYGHLDIVKVLLANGADINAKDNQGKTALNYAKQNGNEDIVAAIEGHRLNKTFGRY